MKQFLIIRHAKSSWTDYSLKDIDRPLNKRGLHDGPKMASYLKKEIKINLDLIYSSPANRALTTAKYFHKEFELNSDIDIRRDIYHADVDDLIPIINDTEEKIQTFAMFGHNPGFTYLVNHFYGNDIENLPTCGIAYFQSNANTWEEVNPDNTELLHLLFPKKTIY